MHQILDLVASCALFVCFTWYIRQFKLRVLVFMNHSFSFRHLHTLVCLPVVGIKWSMASLEDIEDAADPYPAFLETFAPIRIF